MPQVPSNHYHNFDFFPPINASDHRYFSILIQCLHEHSSRISFSVGQAASQLISSPSLPWAQRTFSYIQITDRTASTEFLFLLQHACPQPERGTTHLFLKEHLRCPSPSPTIRNVLFQLQRNWRNHAQETVAIKWQIIIIQISFSHDFDAEAA